MERLFNNIIFNWHSQVSFLPKPENLPRPTFCPSLLRYITIPNLFELGCIVSYNITVKLKFHSYYHWYWQENTLSPSIIESFVSLHKSFYYDILLLSFLSWMHFLLHNFQTGCHWFMIIEFIYHASVLFVWISCENLQTFTLVNIVDTYFCQVYK